MSDEIPAHITWCRRQALACRRSLSRLGPEERDDPEVGGKLERDADLWDRLADEAASYLVRRDYDHGALF